MTQSRSVPALWSYTFFDGLWVLCRMAPAERAGRRQRVYPRRVWVEVRSLAKQLGSCEIGTDEECESEAKITCADDTDERNQKSSGRQNSIPDQHERRFSIRNCRVVGRDGRIQGTANGCTPAR
jgi:hypothetical protein